MRKKLFLVSVGVMMAVAFAAAAVVYAACPDIIKGIDISAYKKVKKGIVEFHHKKHEEAYAKQYPDLYKNGCGECHHDKEHKPLTKITCDDKVQKCIDCHKKPGERPKGKKAPKLNKKERLAYHAEALHYNCKDCHKKFNKKYKPKKAPTTCSKCHPRKKKK